MMFGCVSVGRAYAVILFFLISLPLNSQVVINEIMATNGNTLMETDYYNFPDWVEIYNSGSTSVSLSTYYLSDDIENLQKWKFPSVTLGSNKYYIVYCDKKNTGRHAAFGLNTGGETLYLSDNSGNIIDEFTYGEQYPDVSTGRNPAELSQILYCSTPTPGAVNSTASQTKQSPIAFYSVPAGRISSSASLRLAGSNIRYTTNGEEPDEK